MCKDPGGNEAWTLRSDLYLLLHLEPCRLRKGFNCQSSEMPLKFPSRKLKLTYLHFSKITLTATTRENGAGWGWGIPAVFRETSEETVVQQVVDS